MYVCVYIYIYIYIYIVIYIYIALPPQEVDLSPALKDATGEAFSYAKVIYGNLSQPSLPIYLYIYLSTIYLSRRMYQGRAKCGRRFQYMYIIYTHIYDLRPRAASPSSCPPSPHMGIPPSPFGWG